ncbi:type II CRISPR RNA-guided endonuclease Cas9 [Nitritalea halalkaliphila]|uniref:type II CRISPR RNA-guided endonuclease Cas9 n=1 Tax=Nitritalea halalkaliphila TaxID=590849 RepID=UPI0002E7F832|nr:type II CRISPR RNA-guided endonuclease Cas9 [Nitritalea halalkaliphila]
MKKILGLDLGTNSVGWALIAQDTSERKGEIIGLGSRIIPMSQDLLGDFGKGNSVSQTAERTRLRGVRRLRERYLLRRERLHRVLHILGFLPENYASQIDFTERVGKFFPEKEPKLAYDDSGNFLFSAYFEEMLTVFNARQPELLSQGRRLPQGWTLYYLRKKALTEKISKEALAWVLLNFNQKRGYYQLRGEEQEENPHKLVEFHTLKVVKIEKDPEVNSKGDTWYSLHLENEWVYRRSSKVPLDDWLGKERDFIVTTDLDKEGNPKLDRDGQIKRSFRAPSEDDWGLVKKKTERELERSGTTVGAYIFEQLLLNPQVKVKGKLIKTIERKFYKEELLKIMRTQEAFHPELRDEQLLADAVRELYKHNKGHQHVLLGKDLSHLLIEDILFYQRPLKSQKSSIANCPLEKRYYEKEGEQVELPQKVTSKSHPLFQEFRLLQWLANLRILRKADNKDVTAAFIRSWEEKEQLLHYLSSVEKISNDIVLKFLLGLHGFKGKALQAEVQKYRWNYVFDSETNESKEYPGNTTRADFMARLNRVVNFDKEQYTPEFEESLWHIVYSVTDKQEFERALKRFARKWSLDEETFFAAFRKIPPFKSDYASYSLKAIKKLLPLMRFGSSWNESAIDTESRRRIDLVLDGEYDPEVKDKVRELSVDFTSVAEFQGLPLWFASYLVYGRHAEASELVKWNSSEELAQFIKDFKQHSLRNPIVEQVIVETLRVVKDIWDTYGEGRKDFFDEIHIELGREMKNPAEVRQRMTRQQSEQENTNLRIKAFLLELLKDPDVEDVRPYSPMQQDILKLYEEGALLAAEDIPEDILKISKAPQPSRSDFQRYKIWLEQQYCSPYTGKLIPLNKLFTPAYEIEHVIPQSRYFDDSMSNKVICEAAVNKLKGNKLGLEFIQAHGGERIQLGYGEEVTIFTEAQYKGFIEDKYARHPVKKRKLLADELPESMIERQLNDTRYISKYIAGILSCIVRAEEQDTGFNSKNVVPGSGKVTGVLKQDWGLNDVWNSLILPRFERMNQLSGSNDYTAWNEKHQKFLPTVPLEMAKGFQKKRIDHRHHALDALVVACTTRTHIQYMNNEHARKKSL